MILESFPPRRPALALLLAGLVWAAPAAGQDPAAGPDAEAPPPPIRFEPRYIDAEAYRGEKILLYDWPALTRLVRWTAPVAGAVAEPDSTLSAELLDEFRARVAALAEVEPPDFMAGRADSVRAVLRTVGEELDRAEAMLAESLPGDVATPTGERRPNAPDRDRTYATGPTAVRVPAGVSVGEADTLPGAAIEAAAGEPNYVDLVARALDRLDALVHLVRKLGETASEDPAGGASTPPPDTGPAPPGP